MALSFEKKLSVELGAESPSGITTAKPVAMTFEESPRLLGKWSDSQGLWSGSGLLFCF